MKRGEIIKFGNYFKNNDKLKELIEWKALKVSGNKALLITKNIIDCKPYNEENMDITWEECTLRQWLNNEFINHAFTKKEQDEILVTNLSNLDNSRFGTKGGNDTQDKIFCLSVDEAYKYFKDDEDRECKATKYAIECGAWTPYSSKHKGNCYWWLRSPGYYHHYASVINDRGSIYDYGSFAFCSISSIRPAMWVNLVD